MQGIPKNIFLIKQLQTLHVLLNSNNTKELDLELNSIKANCIDNVLEKVLYAIKSKKYSMAQKLIKQKLSSLQEIKDSTEIILQDELDIIGLRTLINLYSV